MYKDSNTFSKAQLLPEIKETQVMQTGRCRPLDGGK